MASKKISALTALTGVNVASTDVLPIVDTSASETKKITYAELMAAVEGTIGPRQNLITNSGFKVNSQSTLEPVTASATSTMSTELLTNGNFETAGGGGADVFANWSESTGDGTITDETTFVHGGSHACKLTSGSLINTNVYQNFTVLANTVYTLTFWTRGDGVNAGRYYIYDNTGAILIVPTISTGITSTSYTQVTTSFVTPASCVSLQICLKGPAVNGGIAYFDDVSVKQANILTNGDFGSATTGWTGTDCTLASVAGGSTGNCLEVTRTGGSYQYAYERASISGATGKLYLASVYVKSGTSGDESFALELVNYAGSSIINSYIGTSSSSWTRVTVVAEATDEGFYFRLKKNSATAGTMLFDECSLYEVTPGYIASGPLAPDTWYKNPTMRIFREHYGTNTKDGSFYALRLLPAAAGDYLMWPYAGAAVSTKDFFYARFRGRTVTFGMWVKTSRASHFRMAIYDGSYTYSSYHTGGGAYEWLEVTKAISASATQVQFEAQCVNAWTSSSSEVYVSQPVLIYGSSIGSGNYIHVQNEFIWCDKAIPLTKLSAVTGLSDRTATLLGLEAETNGMIGKGVKEISLSTTVNDSGSSTARCYLAFQAGTSEGIGYINDLAGTPNDVARSTRSAQKCDVNGDMYYIVEATGSGTLDVSECKILGVQVN